MMSALLVAIIMPSQKETDLEVAENDVTPVLSSVRRLTKQAFHISLYVRCANNCIKKPW